ncbi:MAG: pyruvate ferredoxin oxidoreductase [Deltaproteobacteria bacterium]|nr:pyruvate ferredoxin oxidoreductase [Deltaproteobacteria bacterium]
MQIIESGNFAAAYGVKLARAQVIAAYPITPQTPLTEKLSEFVESGNLDSQYIPVESEHSALAVCIAATSTGARSFTATSANGLLYMSEQLHWAAGARLPIVMCVVNRGIGAPWTVWNDHQDSMSQRDNGWIQLYANDHQQIIDSVIKAFRLAEDVSIPVMVCYDGYLLSHTYMPFKIPDSTVVDKFLQPFKPYYKLDPENPANFNTVTLPDVRKDVRGEPAPGYIEIRHALHQDLIRSIHVLEEIDKIYAEYFGRGGNPLVEGYKCEDASLVAVGMGSISYHLRDVVDSLREEGINAGVLSVNLYRPFPGDAIISSLKKAERIIVFEKAISYGNKGMLYADIRSALYDCQERPMVNNFIVGIGGREIKTRDLYNTMKDSWVKRRATSDTPEWIGLKL